MKGTDGTASDDFQENTYCGTVKIGGNKGEPVADNLAAQDYFASASERVTVTATANAGYEFIGWYQQVDGKKYELVSSEPTHSYTVSREGVQTIYARFAPTHTVTYQWTETPNECPTKEELNAAEKTLPAAATVMDGDNYPISTDYKANETSIPGTKQENGVTVYGKWTFSGWRDENGNIRVENLADVRKDRTLTGYWTFMPNTRFTLTYQVAENSSSSWTPSNLSAPADKKQYFRTEPVTAAGEPSYKQGELYVSPDLTLKGAWTFGGWKRSDTGAIISATTGSFNMPDRDLTLTGQWSFTPDTYTVSYDIGNGTGTKPELHNSYDYSELSGKTGCVKASGIPFGASITLREFTGTAPKTADGKDTYFAGWSIVKPTSDNLDTIQTQGPGAVVDDETLKASEATDHHVTLYAVYKPVDTATVEFDATPAEGGTVSLRSGSFTVTGSTVTGDDVVSTADPKAGWYFVGWYEETGSDKTKVTEGLSNNGLTLTVTAETMAKKLGPLPKKVNSNETPAHEVRYVAVFEPNTFTIHYEPNYPIIDAGAQSGEMADQMFSAANASRNLSPNQFQYKGYTFDGWTTQRDGTGVLYSDGAAFTQTVEDKGKVTLYAKWKRLPNVTITYTAYPDSLGSVALNSESEAAVQNDLAVQSKIIYEKVNPETGKIVGATATVKSGSVFEGWYNDLTKKNVETSKTFVPQQQNGRYVSASYVARFRPYRYTLHYEANGGTGKMDNQIFQHGQILPLNDCTYSREGYDFMGWENGEKQFSNKAEVQFTDLVPSPKDGDSATLYAVWQERDVTLNYASSDESLGTVTAGSETIGAATGKPTGSTAQAKSGARFDGWYSADGTLLSPELTFVPTKEAAVWQGTTYYAHFSAKRSPSTPSTPAKPDETKPTLAPIPEMLNGKDHYAYLLGYEDGTVRPNGSISRAEVATVLFRLLKDDVRMQNLTKDNAYSDVPDTAWYAAAVSTLSKMGVISGYPDGTFRPNAPITRAEFAAMIARFDETAKSADTPFTDISGHWAENAIGKAYGNGWVEGSSKTVFCPESNLTRAETATLLNRVLHRLPEKESDLLANQIVWPDNPETFWGYLTIQEATNSHEYERKADGVHETQTVKRENRDWSKEFEQ